MTYSGWLASFPACIQPVHTARLYGNIFRFIKNLVRGASWIEGKSLPYRLLLLFCTWTHICILHKSPTYPNMHRELTHITIKETSYWVKLRTLFALSIFHNDPKQFFEETHRRSRADENQVSIRFSWILWCDKCRWYHASIVVQVFSRYRRHSL